MREDRLARAVELTLRSAREWAERDVLSDLLDRMRGGRPPIPLTDDQAAWQAYRLRTEDGMAYTAISDVLRRYHGVDWSDTTVKRRCRSLGASPVPRGPGRNAVAL